MPLPGTSNRNLTTAQNVIKPSNFTRSALPSASTRYDPAPSPNPIKLHLENSIKQYNPPSARPQSKSEYKPVLPRVRYDKPTPKTNPQSSPAPHQFNPADYGKSTAFNPADYGKSTAFNPADYGKSTPSNPTNKPPSTSPLPSVQNPQLPKASLPSATKSGFKFSGVGMSGGGMGFDISEAAATSIALDFLNSNGRPNFPGYNPGNSDIERLGRGISDALRNLGNSLSHPSDRLSDLLNLFPNPYRKHPRTDPQNEDGRPKPVRYVSEWRGLKFYSPNNKRVVQIAAPHGEYSLGEIKQDNPGGNYVFSSPEKNTYAIIYWDNLQGNNTDGYQVIRGSSTCEPDTIQRDPTYSPPSYDLPALLPPGTTPDPGYPPIFTDEDFKPQRDLNNDRARQDEQDRQDAPDPEQERQDARSPQPAPDPWENPFPAPDGTPQPQPYPFPLDPPSPDPTNPTDPYPDTTLGDRLREKVDRIKEKLNERFPAPTDGPQVTINGDPVPSPTSPAPLPDTSLSPLPDTRTKSPPSPTTTKPPTETRLDTETGLTPTKDPDPKPDTPTPEKCKDPCMQGLHDKTDANSKQTEIKVKVFKSCSKAGADGTTKNEIDFEEKLVKVLASEADAYRLLYSRIFALESEQCGDVKAIASVPEWWQARRGADIPQLVIIFAEQFSSGKLGGSRWNLSIPHYNKGKGSRPAIPSYNKGNWFGTLRLTDGSKLGVNAATSTECKRILNRLKIHIPVEFRTKKGKAIKPRIVEDPTADLKECKVTPVRADYYSKGQANMRPDWSINLRSK